MKTELSLKTAITVLEELLLKQFKEEPFHNLYLLYGKVPLDKRYGGTCSDKTLSFINSARSMGFNIYLHSGYVSGKEIHRLARVQIFDRTFFADVGNGWPALKLYPADEEVNYSCFGMTCRTEIIGNKISVFHTRNRKEYLQLVIDTSLRNEDDIKVDISQRFNSGTRYPFSNSLRFSLVVGDRFLFLREDSLEIYSVDNFVVIKGVNKENLPKILDEHFKYDSFQLFEYLLN